MAMLPFPIVDDSLPLPDVPPFVQYLLLHFLTPILAWLSGYVYQSLLTRHVTHPLIRLAHRYDPAAVVAACRSYYHETGPGRPPIYSINTLVRAEIVRAWANACSDPDLEWHLASNLIVRWFVGLPLVGATPDHTTLNRFHAWLTMHHPDTLFRDVLAFLDDVDPEDPAVTPQIVDTFAMASPVTPTSSPARLLLHLNARLATAWLQAAPSAVQAALPPLDLGALRYPPQVRTAEARQAQLAQVVSLATWLIADLTPHVSALEVTAQAQVQALLDALSKVLADEIRTDADGQVREQPRDAKGHYRIMSAVDLEATFRKHEPHPAVLGSNAMIATTPTRIRGAVIATGSTPDQDAPVTVLRQQLAANQPLPPVLIMDQAGGMGKTRAQVAAVSSGQTHMVAQIPHTFAEGESRFTPADFQISGNGQRCTCPNGVTSQRVYHDVRSEGVTFRFFGGDCRGCPFWEACRGPTSTPTSQRSVYLSPYHAQLREAARFNATVVGKGLLRDRWRVEPTIAWLVRYNGCRQARRVGCDAAQCQLFQACALRNLQLWLKRLDQHTTTLPVHVGHATTCTAREVRRAA